MELVVVAIFAFACLLLVCAFAYFGLRSMAHSLDSAHRKIMARNYQELTQAEQAEEWARQVNGQAETQAPREQPNLETAYYGQGWNHP